MASFHRSSLPLRAPFTAAVLIVLLGAPKTAQGGPVGAAWSWCLEATRKVAGTMAARSARAQQARWLGENRRQLESRPRALPLGTPAEVAPTDPWLVAERGLRAAHDLRYGRGAGTYDGGLSDNARPLDPMAEARVREWMGLGDELRKLSGEHIYQLTEPVTLVHGSEATIRRFEVDYNLSPDRVQESVTSGPGVYTFQKRGENYPGDLLERAPRVVYEFQVPAGSRVLDLNDPAVNRMVDRIQTLSEGVYRPRIEQLRQSMVGSFRSLSMSDHDIMRSWAIHDLWTSVGKPDLIIGLPYQGTEIVVRNPALLEKFTTPVVEYPSRSAGRRQSTAIERER